MSKARPPETANSPAEAGALAETRPPSGVLPAQRLGDAVNSGWITAEDQGTSLEYTIPPEAIQPASLDLRLGGKAWKLRCSFLPDRDSHVEERLDDIAFEEIDLKAGATFDVDRPYLVRLIEGLRLPGAIRAKTNPKSSTGRVDVFTRVITDKHHRFDDIHEGYRGNLYLEVVPRSFAILVGEGLALNQLRLMEGEDARLSDNDLYALHRQQPLVYYARDSLAEYELLTSDGLFLSVDLSGIDVELSGRPERIVGYRARRNSNPIDLSATHAYRWEDYWEPVYAERDGRLVLDPEVFYLLLSAEGVCIPPRCAAEMMAYDPTAGELRTHYAGFFDPGFGYDRSGQRPGSRVALEVRARDVPFMVEHRQPICKLAFERMIEEPDVLYGEDLGSNYQGQITMLSKHFVEQTAGVGQLSLNGQRAAARFTKLPS